MKKNEDLKYLLDNINDPDLVYLYCLQDIYGDSFEVRNLPVCRQGFFGQVDLILDIADKFPTVCRIDPETTSVIFYVTKDSK